MLREIQSPQRHVRVLPLRVDGTGTASILEGSHHATLVDNGTGDYTITFGQAFARVPVIGGAVLIGSSGIIQIAAVSASSVQVLVFAVDGTTPADGDFHISIIGFDVADET